MDNLHQTQAGVFGISNPSNRCVTVGGVIKRPQGKPGTFAGAFTVALDTIGSQVILSNHAIDNLHCMSAGG